MAKLINIRTLAESKRQTTRLRRSQVLSHTLKNQKN